MAFVYHFPFVCVELALDLSLKLCSPYILPQQKMIATTNDEGLSEKSRKKLRNNNTSSPASIKLIFTLSFVIYDESLSSIVRVEKSEEHTCGIPHSIHQVC